MSNAPFGRGPPNFENQNTDQEQSNTEHLSNDQWDQVPYDYNGMVYYQPEYAFSGEQDASQFQGKQNFQNNEYYSFAGGQYYQNENASYQPDYAFNYNQGNFPPEFNSSQVPPQQNYNYHNNDYFANNNENESIDDSKSDKVVNNEINTNESNKQSLNEFKNIPLTKTDMSDSHLITPQNFSQFSENSQLPKTSHDISNIPGPSSTQFSTTVTTAMPQMLDTTKSLSKPPSIEPLPSMPPLPNNTTTGVPKNNQFRRVTKESINKNVSPISLDIFTPNREDTSEKHHEDTTDSKVFDSEVAQYDNSLLPSTSTKTDSLDTKSKDTPSQKESSNPSLDISENNANTTSLKANNIDMKESKAKSSDEKEETPRVPSTHSPSSYQPLRSSAENLLIHRKIIGREITSSPATTLWDQPPPSSLNSSLHLIPAVDTPINNPTTTSTSSSKPPDYSLLQDKSLQNTDTGTGSSTLNTKTSDSTSLNNLPMLPTSNYCSNENIDNLTNSVKNLNVSSKTSDAPNQSALEEGEIKDQGEPTTNQILEQTTQHVNVCPPESITQSNIEDPSMQATQLHAKESSSQHQVQASFQSIEDVVQASKSYPNISNPHQSAFTTVQPSTIRTSNQHPVSQPQIHTIHQPIPQPVQPPHPQNLPQPFPLQQAKETKYSSDERPESRASSVRSVASSYRRNDREKDDSDREYRERKYRDREYRDREYRRRDDRERSSSRRRYDDRSPARYEERSRPSSRNDDYSDDERYSRSSRSSSRHGYDHPRSRQSSMRREKKDGKEEYPGRDKRGDDDYRYKDEKRSSRRYRDDRYYEDRDYDRRRDERRYSERRRDDRYYRDDERGYYDRNRERSRSRDPREERSRYPEDQMRRSNRQQEDRYYGGRSQDNRDYYGRSRDNYHSSRRDQYAAPREISEEEWQWRAHEAWNRGEESYRQFYKDYFDYFYNDPQSANLKDPYYDYYKSADKYTRGFYEEMVSYGQAPNVADQSLPHDVRSSRGSSPGFINLSAADRLARDSQVGSRPSSQLSAYEAPDYRQASKRLTPHKYPISHVRATFSPSGHLVKVMPFNPEDGQPAYVQVETINMSEIQEDDEDLVQLKTFPGPLVRNEVHKKDVLDFCKGMSEVVKDDVSSIDVSSAVLLWKFLSLLIKQNGSFIGTDIAELLLDGKNLNEEYSMENPSLKKMKSLSQNSSVANSVSNVTVDNEEGIPLHDKTLVGDEESSTTPSNTTLNSTQQYISTASITNRFRELLLYGRKKDALEWAVKNHLWGHALFLASKMDAKTYSNIVTRFASSSMKMNDPLQTLYQLMTGKQPLSASMLDDKWGDWKPHLSMIMSNPTPRPDLDRKSIIILGDTLASRGMLYASHFCYLIGQVPFGDFNKKSSKLVLIGSSHSLPFCKFFSNYGVWATEVYEYSMSLADPSYLLTHLVSYKFLYMVKLIDAGLMEEAFKYAEVISQAVILKPGLYSSTLIRSLQSINLCLTAWHAHRTPITSELVVEQEPQWCVDLRRVVQMIFDGTIERGDVTDSQVNDSSYGADWPSKQSQQGYNWSEVNFHSQYAANQQQGEQLWPNQDQYSVPSENRQPINEQQQQQYAAYDPATSGFIAQNSQPVGVANNDQQQQQYTQQYQQQQQYNQQAQQQGTHEEHPSFSIGSEVLHKHHEESTPDHHHPPPPLHPMHDALGRKKSRDRTTSGSSTTSRRSSNSMTSAINHPLTPPFSSNFANSTLTAADENEESDNEVKKRKKQPFPGDEVDDGLNNVIKKVNKQDNKKSSGGGWLSFFKRNKPKEMDLPDDSKPKIVWDAVNKAWVDTENPEGSTSTKDLAPPPITLPSNPATDPTKPLPPTENKFSLKQRGARGQYVDVFGGKKAQTADTSALFSSLPKSASMPAKIFTPSAPLSELGNLETTEEHEDVKAVQEEAPKPTQDQMPQQVPQQTSFYPTQQQQFYQPQQQSTQPQQPFQPQQQPFQPQPQQPFQPQQQQPFQPQQQQPFQPQQQPPFQAQQQQPFQAQPPMQQQHPIQQQPQHLYQQPQYPPQNNKPSEQESSVPPVMFDPTQLKGTLHHHSQQPARFGSRRMYPK